MDQNMDTVFDAAKEFDNDFDVIFDREDQLIDTVNGVNEAGDPLTGVDFEDLHQDETDDVKKDDFEQPAEDDGNKNAEGTKEEDIPDNADIEKTAPSDTDKLIKDVDDEYQKADDSTKGVEDTVTATVDNDKDVETEAADLDDKLLTDVDDEYQKTIPTDSGVENTVTGTIENDKDVQTEGTCPKCNKEGCDGSCKKEECDETDAKEDDTVEESFFKKSKAGDDMRDLANSAKDDIEKTKAAAAKLKELNAKKEAVEVEACKKESDIDDMLLDDDEDADFEEATAPEGTVDQKIPDNCDDIKCGESDTDKLIKDVDDEYQKADDSTKGVEDTVTATVDNDKDVQTEATDADVEAEIDSEDDEDEALIDDLAGEDLSYEPSDEDLIDAAINDTDI